MSRWANFARGGGGGGGGDSNVERTGLLDGNFEKKTLIGTNIQFRGRGLKLFSSIRGTNSKTTHYILLYFFQLKVPIVGFLGPFTLRGAKSVFVFLF